MTSYIDVSQTKPFLKESDLCHILAHDKQNLERSIDKWSIVKIRFDREKKISVFFLYILNFYSTF